MRRILTLFVIIQVVLTSYSQQDPVFSLGIFNQMAINPAYAGSSGMVCATAINRLQWVGFEGAPRTTMVNINAAIKPLGLSSGIGLNIASDQFGFNKDLGVDLSYAVRFKVAGGGQLALGLNGGFINNSLEATKWITPGGVLDSYIPAASESSVNFDLGFGLYYNNPDMYFGFSVAHLNGTQFNKAETPSHYNQHYYLTGGYVLQLPSPDWQFNPSVFVCSNISTTQLSVTASTIYNKKFWFGVSYRVGEAVVGMLGFELFNGLRIGYAYDYSTEEIRKYNSGSHEFMLGYCFTLKKERPPQQYKSIRFL